MTVPELINHQMDYFVGKMLAKNELSHDKVIEVATHIGAYLIRTRHIQNKSISNQEIELVLQSISDFINANFENQFSNEEFISIKENTLKLLKRAEFDQEIQDYFKQFYI